MKHLMVILICAIIGVRAVAQYDGYWRTSNVGFGKVEQFALQSTKPAVKYDKQSQAWKRYCTLRAVGWSMLGVGLPLTYVSFGVGIVWIAYGGGDMAPLPLAGTIVGGAMSLASIPLLITAYRYKKKARINVDLEFTQLSAPIGRQLASAPALRVAFKF